MKPIQVGKQLVRNAFEARGLDIIRRLADNGPALPLLKLLIEHCVMSEGKGSIIQIGANDGLMSDPIHEIISALSLPAILVEPLPDMFERLVINYAGQPNVKFENVAIGETEGTADIFRVVGASHLPDWVQGIASFDRAVLTGHNRLLNERIDKYIQSIRVPIITVGDLLDRHHRPAVIALQIDTEGHDFSVIKSAVQAGCLPRIINYETKHLSFEDQVECRELLAGYGYSFLSNFQDTLAYRVG